MFSFEIKDLFQAKTSFVFHGQTIPANTVDLEIW